MERFKEDIAAFASDRLDYNYEKYKDTENFKEIEKKLDEALELLSQHGKEVYNAVYDAFIQRENYTTTSAYLQGLTDALKLRKI